MSTLELNCLVLGDDRSHIFPVKILSTESVGALKKAIKDEKKPAFDHIPADTLILWNVSVRDDEHLEENIKELDKALAPMDVLSEVFPTCPVQKHLHIVVKVKALPTGKLP
jgi:hypothetical protein